MHYNWRSKHMLRLLHGEGDGKRSSNGGNRRGQGRRWPNGTTGEVGGRAEQ